MTSKYLNKPLHSERETKMEDLATLLMNVLENLTVIRRQSNGGIVIGPVGWEQSRFALDQAKEILK